jgi:hypothetical protein
MDNTRAKCAIEYERGKMLGGFRTALHTRGSDEALSSTNERRQTFSLCIGSYIQRTEMPKRLHNGCQSQLVEVPPLRGRKLNTQM